MADSASFTNPERRVDGLRKLLAPRLAKKLTIHTHIHTHRERDEPLSVFIGNNNNRFNIKGMSNKIAGDNQRIWPTAFV